MTPQRFVATGVMIAILIDLSRLSTYAAAWSAGELDITGREGLLMVLGTFAAFTGAFIGTRYLQKATIGTVRTTVSVLMFVIGAALVTGLVGT
jgi:uncharacterized membrane protein YfcA